MKYILPIFFLFTIFTVANLKAATPELIELRNQTKTILTQRHCFNCHSPNGNHPLEKAMKVYNLERNQWFNTMTDRQLVEFKKRILDKMSPDELKEMGGDSNEKPLDSKLKIIVSRFVDLEISNRRENPLENILSQMNR